MSTNTTTFILSLNNAAVQFNRYGVIFLPFFGGFGNILNLLVLSQRKFRTKSCLFLFLISSIANLISIISGLIIGILAGWGINLVSEINWFCKLIVFVLFVSKTVASWLITSASIDRWFSSSTNHQHRQRNSLKNAYGYTIIVILFSMLLYAQVLYCYEANLLNTPLKCYSKTRVCRLTTDLSYALITIIVPIILMVVFSLKTISNVRRVQRQVHIKQETHMTAIASKQQSKRKKLDHHLLLMLLMQVTLILLCTLPQAMQKIYSTITEQQIKSSVQNAIENLIFNCFVFLAFFADGIPFYIYTLCGGKIFRKALVDLFKRARV